MKSIIKYSFLFVVLLLMSSMAPPPVKIALLVNGKNEQTAEYAALQKFFDARKINYTVQKITLDEVANNKFDLKKYQVVWYHRPDTLEKVPSEIKMGKAVKSYLNQGGKMMLTLDAVKLLNAWGIEKSPIVVKHRAAVDEGFGRKLGFHGFRSHPVFIEMHGGAYIWHAKKDMKMRTLGFFENNLPTANGAKVIGIDWAYITYDDKNKLLWETPYGKGKVLAVGAYTYFAPDNFNTKELEQFTDNCLNYLNGKFEKENQHFWTYEVCKVQKKDNTIDKIKLKASTVWQLKPSPLSLSRKATNNYFDLAGKRSLVMGKEKAGIEEIWTHPVMSARDFNVGVKIATSDTICWLKNISPKFEVRPEAILRTYQLPNGTQLEEIISTSVKDPIATAHYQWDGGTGIEHLVYSVKSNLRYMWPYNEEALGSLNYTWSRQNNTIVVSDKNEEFVSVIGSNSESNLLVGGQFDGFKYANGKWEGTPTDKLQTAFLVEIDVQNKSALDVCFASGNEGISKTLVDYSNAISDAENVLNEATTYYNSLLKNTVNINTPDPEFNEGYKMAVLGTSKFEVETPGIGKSLMAGYSTTTRGWGGSQKVSGRPGYAWYFGRDAVWSGFAVNNYGNFELVKQVLKTFIKFQNVDGKIYHELTSSGSVHYDASDSTPLFVNLFAHYLRYSGDVEFVRANWGAIQKAIDFCYSTDTDGDGLIEISNVGHGWLEGGKLYGAHTEFYLSGIWAAALRDASYMAKGIGKEVLAEGYLSDSKKVTQTVEEFWNKDNYYNYGKYRDGSYTKDFIILTTVPVYFNVLDKERSKTMIEAFASNSFSADWGMRIMSNRSPIYDPKSYYDGGVLPLFTGWTSLAEYQTGRYNQGFTNLRNNLMHYREFSMGSSPEVLIGENYRPGGVTPHQCWSEALGLQPIFEGMLGYRPDALTNTVGFAPRLPFDWKWFEASNVKFGKNSFEFKFKKQSDTDWVYNLTSNQEFKMNFTTTLPLGSKIQRVLVNGNDVEYTILDNKEYLDIRLDKTISITSSTEIHLLLAKEGFSTLPTYVTPELMAESKGFRILKQQLEGNSFKIDIEGKSGSTYDFKLLVGTDIINYTGAELLKKEADGFALFRVTIPADKEKYQQKSIRINLK
ncbi:GH116 family glycosyl hydrolase [Flavobacterium granuli]|uniref:Amylo-alpha-1,6-glucosidase n=1 Tax=Flavobacterium granuli TaxID=280093 RepID=A0A1M5JSS6_9FLAO|nr:GH116 family glycosyl hydrolase [Flavobacterium granuli]PRZ26047.1 amylo-alpha-1,6-glucosidase [Flavobacterium granuli]SHG43596.1 Amylo-alpha-1,6-glucosidase [Flavobacterium granuli]